MNRPLLFSHSTLAFALFLSACNGAPNTTDAQLDTQRTDVQNTQDVPSGTDVNTTDDTVELDNPTIDSSNADSPSVDGSPNTDVFVRDSGVIDAGLADAGDTGIPTCRGPRDCTGGTVCSIDACGTNGTCVVAGRCNSTPSYVCGCDGMTYTNDCIRVLASVGKRSNGMCPTGDGGLTDASICTGPAPASCCNIDSDCNRGSECSAPGPTCAMGGTSTGVCKVLPPAGRCWRNGDCTSGTCIGADVCECGRMCFQADTLGTCQ